jgi:hypothetical protein
LLRRDPPPSLNERLERQQRVFCYRKLDQIRGYVSQRFEVIFRLREDSRAGKDTA